MGKPTMRPIKTTALKLQTRMTHINVGIHNICIECTGVTMKNVVMFLNSAQLSRLLGKETNNNRPMCKPEGNRKTYRYVT